MPKKLILCVLLIYSTIGFAQIKRTANWYFGKQAGLYFTDTGVQILNNGQLNTWEGCSSISDEQGNLLLYSDGKNVWNKFHKIIKNGTGLLGDISSTQSALILPLPQNDSIYVIITAPHANNYSIGMNYTYVNIKSNQDSAVLITKNILLHKSSSEKLTSIKHQNGKDLWIIGHEFGNNRFFCYLLTQSGFNLCPVYSDVGFYIKNDNYLNIGYMKSNFKGNQIVNNYLFDNSKAYFEIFNFNNFSGKLDFKKKISNTYLTYGVEFSQNNRYLYISDDKKLFQINLQNYSLQTIATSPIYYQYQGMQIGLNGKIYITRTNDSSLAVINYPDSIGAKCDFVARSQSLGSKISQFGLPNFNQSYFYTPSIDYSYQLDCRSNSIEFWGKDTFKANRFQWGMRKLYSTDTFKLVSSSKNIMHTFTDTGSVQVRYIAAYNNRSDTALKTLIIYPKVNPHFLGSDTVFAAGSNFIKTLTSPPNAYCNRWFLNDSLIASSDTFHALQFGTYICQSSMQSFCVVSDTLQISSCIDTLAIPKIQRSRDSLMVSNYDNDSLIWIRNGMLVQKGRLKFLHFKDTGHYAVIVVRPLHCTKASALFAVKTVCIDTLSNPIISRSRDSLFVNNLQADSLYWYQNGQLIHSSTTAYLNINSKGQYTVKAVKKYYCSKTSTWLLVDRLSAIQTNIAHAIDIYPNPSEGTLNIACDQAFTMQVFDAMGRKITEQSHSKTIELPQGIYTVYFTLEGGTVVKKVVVL